MTARRRSDGADAKQLIVFDNRAVHRIGQMEPAAPECFAGTSGVGSVEGDHILEGNVTGIHNAEILNCGRGGGSSAHHADLIVQWDEPPLLHSRACVRHDEVRHRHVVVEAVPQQREQVGERSPPYSFAAGRGREIQVTHRPGLVRRGDRGEPSHDLPLVVEQGPEAIRIDVVEHVGVGRAFVPPLSDDPILQGASLGAGHRPDVLRTAPTPSHPLFVPPADG